MKYDVSPTRYDSTTFIPSKNVDGFWLTLDACFKLKIPFDQLYPNRLHFSTEEFFKLYK